MQEFKYQSVDGQSHAEILVQTYASGESLMIRDLFMNEVVTILTRQQAYELSLILQRIAGNAVDVQAARDKVREVCGPPPCAYCGSNIEDEHETTCIDCRKIMERRKEYD